MEAAGGKHDVSVTKSGAPARSPRKARAVGREVAKLRRDAGLTQKELAESSGVAQSNIAAYESGRRRPSQAMVARLAHAAKPRPSQVLAKQRTKVLALGARHHAESIRVFGSVASGTDRPGSDLDLLVRFTPEASLFDQVNLAIDAELLLGVRVDVVSEAGLKGRRGQSIVLQARPM
jgi:predicted nucleotidyltransferase